MSHCLPPLDQWNIFSQNLEKYVGKEDLLKKLETARPLRIKLGVDPTRPDLTFGHWVVFNKLKQFQQLGHQIIFLIGDYTTQIGDPTGRSTTRPLLTPEEIEKNSKTYLDQAFKVLDGEKTLVKRNSEWFNTLSFADLLGLSRHVTVAQVLEREDFSKRYQGGTPISLIEFLYPLLQAYDSVVLKADVEMGGSDQLFNMCMGRQLQRAFGQPEQAVLCMPLLVGLDGARKMSKSYDNYIAFNDSAENMFGKLMSIPDTCMWDYFRLLALESTDQIEARKQAHPMSTKKELALKLVEHFYSDAIAQQALRNFETIFSKKNLPEAIPACPKEILQKEFLVDIILASGTFNDSKKELKRLISQGGVEVNEKKVTDPLQRLEPNAHYIIRVGKRTFFRV